MTECEGRNTCGMSIPPSECSGDRATSVVEGRRARIREAVERMSMGLFDKGPKFRELQRTCQACGTVWFVTPKEARAVAPNQMQITGARMEAAGASLTLFSRRRTETQLRVMRLEQERERIASISRCGNCGSTRFTQVGIV